MGDNQAYKTVLTGEIGGSTNAERLPDIACSKVRFIGKSGNSGNVYLGGSSGVTVAQASTNSTTGFEIDAGFDTGWIEVDNLNKFWHVCDNAGDELIYMALR